MRKYLYSSLALLLPILLISCGTTPVPPGVTITSSGGTTQNATYTLIGTAYSESGVEAVNYSLNGGSNVALSLSGDRFERDVTLAPGTNEITVTATSTNGASESDDIEVTYLAAVTSISVSPSVAMPGESVTISGSDFGDTPTVSFDGIEGAVTSASDSQIVVTVPEGIWGYPEIEVANSYSATSDSQQLFVGQEVGTDNLTGAAIQDTLDDLPEGGAARLGAGTYVLSGVLLIDNRSLYGLGDGSVVDANGNSIGFLAGNENTVVIQDLSMEGDNFVFGDGRMNTSGAFGVASPTTLKMPNVSISRSEAGLGAGEGLLDLSSRLDQLPTLPRFEVTWEEQGLGLNSITTQATGLTGTFSFRGVTIEESTPGGGTFEPSSLTSLTAGFEVTNSTFAIETIFLGSAGLTINDSSLSGGLIVVAAQYAGALTIEGSELTGSIGVILGSVDADGVVLTNSTVTAELGIQLIEQSSGKLTIADSDLTVNDGSIAVLVDTGPATITGSRIEALDGGGGLADVTLEALVGTTVDGPATGITIRDNHLLHADGDLIVLAEGSSLDPTVAGPAQILVIGNEEISGGTVGFVNMSGDVEVRDNVLIEASAELVMGTPLGDLRVEGNDLRSGAGFSALTENMSTTAASNDVLFRNNTVVADAGSVVGQVLIAAQYGSFEASGNSVTLSGEADDSIVLLAGFRADAGGDCNIADNELEAINTLNDSVTDSSHVVLGCLAISATEGSAVISNNVLDASSGESSYAGIVGQLVDATVTGNNISASDYSALLTQYGELEADSSNSFASAMSADWATIGATVLTAIGDVTNPASLTVSGAAFTGSGVLVADGSGDEYSQVTVNDSTVELGNNSEFGLRIESGARLAASGNTFTVSGAAAGTAIVGDAAEGPIHLRIDDANTFTGFEHALYLQDDGDADGNAATNPANGIDAMINDNVFEFAIDALGDAAVLHHVEDTIDAENNVWGANTSVVTVEGYVERTGQTTGRGGDIDVDPITQP